MMDTQTHHTLGRSFFEVLLLQECFIDTGSWVWDTGEKHLDHQDRDGLPYIPWFFSLRRSISSHQFSPPSAEAGTQSSFSSFWGKLVFKKISESVLITPLLDVLVCCIERRFRTRGRPRLKGWRSAPETELSQEWDINRFTHTRWAALHPWDVPKTCRDFVAEEIKEKWN